MYKFLVDVLSIKWEQLKDKLNIFDSKTPDLNWLTFIFLNIIPYHVNEMYWNQCLFDTKKAIYHGIMVINMLGQWILASESKS